MSDSATFIEVEVTPEMVVVPVTSIVIPPHMVAKATRGAELQALFTQTKKELDALKAEFGALLDANKVETFTNAANKVVAKRTHGAPNVLDQGALKVAHPEIVKAFTHPNPWDSVAFKA